MPHSIVFTQSNSIVSRAIRWFTHGRTSHCGLAGISIDSVPLVIHADLRGARIQTRTSFMAGKTVVSEYVCLAPLYAHAGLDELGEGYDVLRIVGLAWVILASWVGLRFKNPLVSPRKTICTQFLLSLDPDGNVVGWEGLDRYSTSPEDLMDVAERSPSFRRVA